MSGYNLHLVFYKDLPKTSLNAACFLSFSALRASISEDSSFKIKTGQGQWRVKKFETEPITVLSL